MNPIPENVTAYNVYSDGEKLIGVDAEIELPSFEAATSEVSGPGILGTIDAPSPGHFGNMTFGITFRSVSKESVKLKAPRAHTITLRANQKGYDPAAGEYKQQGLKIVVRGVPAKFTTGKLKASESTGTQVELNLSYIKIELGDKTLIELDKYNYIYVVDGVDYMAEIRKNI